jgi:hypothetical protein
MGTEKMVGSYWHLYLSSKVICSGKNRIPAKLMSVFQEEEKYIKERWARQLEEGPGDDEDAEEISVDLKTVFGYQARVGTVARRLKLMGFGGERCVKRIADICAEFRSDDGSIDAIEGPYPDSTRYEISCEASVKVGLIAYTKALNTLGPWGKDLSGLEKACLQELEPFIEDPGDPRILLGALLADENPNKMLRMDLYDLLAAGWFSRLDAISTTAVQELTEDMASTGPIIVITEGSFDSRVLQRALRLVRPDIADYFKFLDFDSTRAPGGTDQVVQKLRSFAAAGVMNRVIALLDNDAAGRQAEEQLARTGLPNNYRFCRLPDLDYAKEYPTLGPSGGARHNVNGRACSVEFYFGVSCLADGSGPIPIRWTGFNEKIGDYQGELTNKRSVQKNIDEILTKAELDSAANGPEWNAMRRVAETLVSAAEVWI